MMTFLLIIFTIYAIGFIEILAYYIYFNPYWLDDINIHVPYLFVAWIFSPITIFVLAYIYFKHNWMD